MKSRELQLHFENMFRTLDKTGIRKYFQTYQIEQFLNEAYDQYINELAKEFEINEKARKALSRYTLRLELDELTAPNFNKIDSSSKLFGISDADKDLNDILLLVVEEHVEASTGPVKVKPVTHDYYFANIQNKYKRPYEDLVWRLDISIDTETVDKRYEAIHELVSRNIVYTDYVITFIRKYEPVSIKDDSEIYLPDVDCKNIATLAVSLAAKTLGLTQADNTAAGQPA